MNVCIRPAQPADSALAVKLIHLSMGEEMDWLFGQEAGYPADAVMAALYARRGNRFSWNLCWVAEADGQAVGLLLAFAGRRLPVLEAVTGLHLVGVFGLRATWRLARKQRLYGDLVEARPDEYYVSNLGVLPEFQGRGIGGALLDFADEQARAAGLGKCSLLVAQDNPALRLYRRRGYEIAASYTFPVPEIGHGRGMHRMVKQLQRVTTND